MIMERIRMNPAPRYNQVWKTKNGHLVRILIGAVVGPRTTIETEYVDAGEDGCVDGHRGANFHMDGHAVLGDDVLLERVK